MGSRSISGRRWVISDGHRIRWTATPFAASPLVISDGRGIRRHSQQPRSLGLSEGLLCSSPLILEVSDPPAKILTPGRFTWLNLTA